MDDRKNREGYSDTTAYKAITHEDRSGKAFYVFKTMISVARLAGFYVTQALVIEDGAGTKYNSDKILGRNTK